MNKIRDHRKIDWDMIRTQAFAQGYNELTMILNQVKPDSHNDIKVDIAYPKYTNTLEFSRAVRDQANSFGLKCSIWDWSNWDPSYISAKNKTRRLTIGAYA